MKVTGNISVEVSNLVLKYEHNDISLAVTLRVCTVARLVFFTLPACAFLFILFMFGAFLAVAALVLC